MEHPRARGENFFGDMITKGNEGTSPRTRGKPSLLLQEDEAIRNIPAHAGKTSMNPTSGYGKTEHPRARGENPADLHAVRTARGTSPRTRGKPIRAPDCGGWNRNIPAHAGKTSTIK